MEGISSVESGIGGHPRGGYLNVLDGGCTTRHAAFHARPPRGCKVEITDTSGVRVNFGTLIGNYVDPVTGDKMPTMNGIIHYGKDGVHIVPARP
ncbi:polymorphic toxin type 50 domain-containing protein [Ralstonia pseudosolanacearum]